MVDTKVFKGNYENRSIKAKGFIILMLSVITFIIG